jgi:hypothetical protein
MVWLGKKLGRLLRRISAENHGLETFSRATVPLSEPREISCIDFISSCLNRMEVYLSIAG